MDDSNYEIGDEIYCDENKFDEYDEPDRKKVRYLQRYKKEWENDPKFVDWLEPIQNDPYAAYCNVCCSTLTARKKDLMDHSETRKHRKNLVYKRNNPMLYQKMMMNMREVDASVVMEKSSAWTEDATQHLIKLIEQEHDRFYDTTCKKQNLYALISNEMNKSGFPCMPYECQKKWESLRKSYERVLTYQVKGLFRSKFPYFNLIHRFMAKEIDPLGMREKMLCQKLGRDFDPGAPLILDGTLDGTAFTTTLVAKREPNADSSSASEEIIISSFDINEDQSADHMALDVQDIDLEAQIEAFNSSQLEYKDSDQIREWEDQAVSVLLSVMDNIDFNVNMMGEKLKFHEAFWENVSSDLHNQYCEVTPKECRIKWCQLLNQYRQIFQQIESIQQVPNRKGRPRKKPYWQHYDSVAQILKKIHAAKNSSVGKMNSPSPNDTRLINKSSKSQHTLKRKLSEGETTFASVNNRKVKAIKLNNSDGNLSTGMVINKIIKQEQMEQDDEDVEFNEDVLSIVNGEINITNSTDKFQKLQYNLMRVTERLETLERDNANKNDELTSINESNPQHQTQVLSLLTNILSEMKKMNSNKCNNCFKSSSNEERVSIHVSNNSDDQSFTEAQTITLSHDNNIQVTALSDGTIAMEP